MGVNLTGAFLMVKAALPAMIARGGGSVILIASQLGRVASPGRPAHCATKGALIQLAKGAAADHAAQGIRANTISPARSRRVLRRHKDMREARKALGPKHLLDRLGQPEEMARAAIYLASDAAAFVTGSDLLVTGSPYRLARPASWSTGATPRSKGDASSGSGTVGDLYEPRLVHQSRHPAVLPARR